MLGYLHSSAVRRETHGYDTGCYDSGSVPAICFPVCSFAGHPEAASGRTSIAKSAESLPGKIPGR